jgi:hypothetical protein
VKEVTDEQEARRLLRPLAGEPDKPARLDVPRAMADGRRRRRTRWWATGVAVAALTATSVAGGTLAVAAIDRSDPAPRRLITPAPSLSVAAPRVSGPAACTVTRLPTAGVAKAVVTGGDPTGRYLVGRLYRTSDRDFNRGLVVWRDGRIVAETRMPGGDGAIEDINADGVGVGYSLSGEDPIPYAYRDGRMSRLKGGSGTTHAVNRTGVIVGQVGEQAARWESATAAPEKLKVPAGTRVSTAIDIAEDGTILGTVESARSTIEQTGYLWRPDGTGDYLPLPIMDNVRADFFWPESINNGWVTGRGGKDDTNGTWFAYFRYRIDAGRYQRLPDEAGMPARVAANGWVLAAGASPTIISDLGVTRLPGYRKEQEYQLSSFSDDGLVAGGHSTGLTEGTDNQPLMWRCRASR